MKFIQFLLLFSIQTGVTLCGYTYFGAYAPFLMLFVSSVGVCFIFNELKNTTNNGLVEYSQVSWWWSFLPLVFVLVLQPSFKSLLHDFSEPDRMTDVIGQLNTQYNRFIHGIMPYSPVTKFSYAPYPVYMPMHWLPLGINYGLQIDVRWSGYIVFCLSSLLYGYYTIRIIQYKTIQRIVLSAMPAFCISAFLYLKPIEIALSLETIVAAYYLILITGLLARNHFLIILGLVLCLLSRYTLVFWLPLFAFIYFKEYDLKRSAVLWGTVLGSILLLYVFPFLFKDPSILTKGITYHNECAVNLLKNTGDGVHFANFIDRNTQYDGVQTVRIIRIIQLISMILLNALGIFVYHRFRNIHALDTAALFLYIIVLAFFISSPMVFYYYYLVTLILLGSFWIRVK